jgi:hypothetical protein
MLKMTKRIGTFSSPMIPTLEGMVTLSLFTGATRQWLAGCDHAECNETTGEQLTRIVGPSDFGAVSLSASDAKLYAAPMFNARMCNLCLYLIGGELTKKIHMFAFDRERVVDRREPHDT